MNKIISRVQLATFITFLPIITFAQPISGAPAVPKIGNINELATLLAGIGKLIIYLLIGLAVVYIVWNVVQTVVKGSDPAAKNAALMNVFYGIAGLAIIFSIWGLVSLLLKSFNTGDQNIDPSRFPKADFVGDGNTTGTPGSVRSPSGTPGSVRSPSSNGAIYDNTLSDPRSNSQPI